MKTLSFGRQWQPNKLTMYGKIVIIYPFSWTVCVVVHFMEMCIDVAVNLQKHLCDNHLNGKRIENCIQFALYSGGFSLLWYSYLFHKQQHNNGRCFNQKSYQGHRHQTAILSMTHINRKNMYTHPVHTSSQTWLNWYQAQRWLCWQQAGGW